MEKRAAFIFLCVYINEKFLKIRKTIYKKTKNY